jgi:RND family efflux transporter MFP subunit
VNQPILHLEDSDSRPVETVYYQQQQPRRSRRGLGIAAIAVLVVAGLGWKFFHHPAAPPPPPPAAVTAGHPLVRQVAEWDDYVGRFAPSLTVEVRPRVSGAVTAVLFKDGDLVRKGQPLFIIDPRPYRAALDEAKADAASAASSLALAKSDYGRVAGLKGDEAVSGSEVDSLRTKVRSAAAALAAAQARITTRALDVEFSTVRAPIAGRVSNRRIDAGNLVSGEGGANATLLTTVNAVDPIYFNFDASEALFLKTQRERAGNHGSTPVEVRLQDETEYKWKGRLDFTDNTLDPRSGTIRVRAVFANQGGFLTPGLFGNMRLASARTVPAMLVPDEAVQSDQIRKVVYVVGADGTVAAKPVDIGPVIGHLRVIRSGLLPSDEVILSNFQSAAPGSKVTVTAGKIETDPVSATPSAAPAEPVSGQATLVN